MSEPNLNQLVEKEIVSIQDKNLKDLQLIKRFIAYKLKRKGLKYFVEYSPFSGSEYFIIENNGYDIKVRFSYHQETRLDNSNFYITQDGESIVYYKQVFKEELCTSSKYLL